MIANRLCAFTLATALAAFWSVPPATAATYDGSWNMLAVTTNGHCGVINIGMGITPRPHLFDGRKIRQAPDQLAGRVSGSGQALLTAVAGPRIAKGKGRFNQSRATGTWSGTGPSGVCTGVWSAVRA